MNGANDKNESKKLLKINGFIFFLFSFLHIVRIVIGWDAWLGDWEVQFWINWFAAMLGIIFAYVNFSRIY